MSWGLRRFRRYGLTAVGVFGVSTAALVLPPKEQLPAPLLPSRVLFEGFGRVGRCAYVAAGIYVDYTMSVSSSDSQEAWDAVHTRCAHRLVHLAETNGGLYVKAGQIFANMTHILPHHYCKVMAVLQDAVVKRPYAEVAAVLESSLGKPIAEVFSSIDEVPIAAASLAQVHRGRLLAEDADVAIKVQYIDIAQRFNGDMRTIDLMLCVAGQLFPGYDFGQIIRKLNDTVAAELDFKQEARNCGRTAEDLIAGGFGDRVVCPRVFWRYTSERVLVSQFVTGAVKISDRAGIEALGLNVAEVATNFFDAIADGIFRTGFFHGDPHAGNVLVHRLPNGKPQVVLLDFGLCAELDPAHRREISDIWTASTTHDSSTLQRIAARYHCTDFELFASCFLNHPYSYYSLHGRVTSKGEVESMRQTVKNEMRTMNGIVASLPKEYALILRSMMATKAINRELGDAANRPLRLLRYSLRTSYADAPRLQFMLLLAQAWITEWISTAMLAFAKWRYPELMTELESSLQVSG